MFMYIHHGVPYWYMAQKVQGFEALQERPVDRQANLTKYLRQINESLRITNMIILPYLHRWYDILRKAGSLHNGLGLFCLMSVIHCLLETINQWEDVVNTIIRFAGRDT